MSIHDQLHDHIRSTAIAVRERQVLEHTSDTVFRLDLTDPAALVAAEAILAGATSSLAAIDSPLLRAGWEPGPVPYLPSDDLMAMVEATA